MNEAFEYLKKQIEKELERYNYSVKRHGHERVSPTLHIQIHVDEGIEILENPRYYTEEDLSQAFYKGRERKRLPDGYEMFIRPTFNGYLRELDGQEDPYENWKQRVKEYNDNPPNA